MPVNSQEIKPTAVGSLGDLVGVVKAAVIAAGADGPLWYRGQRNAWWDVQTSIHRRYRPEDERDFVHRFRSRAAMRYAPTPPYRDRAAWLSLMQHYGLPTRLLDWSRSPLVAAYFAVERFLVSTTSVPDADVVIWMLRPHVLNRIKIGSQLTPSIVSHQCAPLIGPAFDHLEPEPDGTNVMAVMAAEIDLRLFVQQGCFTIHSDPTPLNRMSGHSAFLDAVIIPAERIPAVADELDLCGFREGDIFPDLGHLARELRHRHDW